MWGDVMGRSNTVSRRTGAALAALVCVAAICVTGGPATAQVLEIGAEGAVTTYAGPAVYTDGGVRSLMPQPPKPAAAAPAEVSRAIDEAAQRHAVSAPLAKAVAWQESRFNPAAVSPKGALGVMQLMPGAARTLGVDAGDLKGNIEGGVVYLGQMLQRFGGDLPRALAAYNAGPGAVARYGGVPPYAETQAYVRGVLGQLNLTRLIKAGAE
jgi:soluble lytic murein transglycosylase-like protein